MELQSMQMFKKHIYNHHTEYDVKVKYGKTVEEFIGDYYMKRFRESTLKMVVKGTHEKMIEA